MDEQKKKQNCEGCTGFSGMICYLKGNPCYLKYCGEVEGTGKAERKKEA